MTRPLIVAIALASLVGGTAPGASEAPRAVRIADAVTGAAIADAVVTMNGRERRSDANGIVLLEAAFTGAIAARAAGYLRGSLEGGDGPRFELRLTPFRPRALYLSVYGIGSRVLRSAALDLIDTTELNAVVIDVKGDRGLIPYRSAIPLASQVGAQRVITVADLPALVAELRERDIYTIARIVVFKDDLLASARPDLAVRRDSGVVYRDRESLQWTDPFSREVWDYNVAVAVEAAAAGFDEIQFDYVRLPDAAGLQFARPATFENRTGAIDGFLMDARRALAASNVFLAADVFGYICWNTDDTHIGQQLEHVVGIVDYVSPMLYPSSFQYGIPGVRDPVQQPDEIVARSLERAIQRTGVAPGRFRPWLQAFQDYAFDRRAFSEREIRAQIDAAEATGAGGWMLWNPRNRYVSAGLRPEPGRGITSVRQPSTASAAAPLLQR
jgi:hypothetical protein